MGGMLRTPTRRGGLAALTAAVVLVGCTGEDEPELDPTAAPPGTEDGDGGGADEPAPAPTSSVTVEPIDGPRSAAEIRVGEIIVEFDGEVTDEGTVLTLEEPILFDFDESVLKPEAREALDDIAEVVAFFSEAPVEVIGHTDDVGSREYNLGLSSDRAAAVVAGLTERGIPSDRLSAEGRAFDEPVASNDSDAGRAQNRRVEVLLVGVFPDEDVPADGLDENDEEDPFDVDEDD